MEQKALEQAAALYREGLSYKALERRFGIPANTLMRELQKAGVPPRPGGPGYAKLTTEQVLAIGPLYASGKSLPEIGRLLGVRPEAILYRMEQLGLDRRASRDACRNYTINPHYFARIDTPEKVYWLGFFAADGSIVRGQIRLALGRKDDAHVVAFARAIGAEHPIYRDLNSKGRPQTRVQIGCYQMVADLARYGIVARKTETLTYPDIPAEFDRHFIRGYFDGDGSIGGQKQPIATIMGTESFLIRCAEIAFASGITKKLRSVYKHPSGNAFILAIGGHHQAKRLYDWFYQDCTVCLERKQERFRQLLGL